MADKRKPGRPRTLDRSAIMSAVCDRVADGELVRDVCVALNVEPRRVRAWALEPEFAPLYTRARESQAHALAERALEIAHGVDIQTVAALEELDRQEDEAQSLDPKRRFHAVQVINGLRSNAIQRDKLRVDALKWMTSKIAPRVYGDKLQVDLPPRDLSKLSDEELAAIAAGKAA